MEWESLIVPTTDTLFATYMIAGVQTSLDRVRAAAYLVQEADRQQAWHILSFALNVAAAWPVTRELLLALAPKMEQAGFREEWIPYLAKGLHAAQSVADGQAVAECALQLGLLYRLLSRFDDAYHWTTLSVDHFATLGDTRNQARTLNELGWLLHLQHQYQEAKSAVEQALQLLPEVDPERAMSYRVLGVIAIYQMDYPSAETYHRQALAMLAQQDENHRTAWCLQNLALALRWQNRYEEVFPLYTRAAAILERSGDISNLGILRMNLGSAYYYYGEPQQALSHFSKAEEIAIQLQDKIQIAKISTHVGLAYLALNAFVQAESAFQQAITTYGSLGDHGWRLNAIDGLAMTYLAGKEIAKARQILQAAIAELPLITHLPNYHYLHQTLHEHLLMAEQAEK